MIEADAPGGMVGVELAGLAVNGPKVTGVNNLDSIVMSYEL